MVSKTTKTTLQKQKCKAKIEGESVFFSFEDGREYKLQLPHFFQVHKAIFGEDGEHDLFMLGVENLRSLNEQSPNIDEAYFTKNFQEGYFWSQILRGFLSPA